MFFSFEVGNPFAFIILNTQDMETFIKLKLYRDSVLMDTQIYEL